MWLIFTQRTHCHVKPELGWYQFTVLVKLGFLCEKCLEILQFVRYDIETKKIRQCQNAVWTSPPPILEIHSLREFLLGPIIWLQTRLVAQIFAVTNQLQECPGSRAVISPSDFLHLIFKENFTPTVPVSTSPTVELISCSSRVTAVFIAPKDTESSGTGCMGVVGALVIFPHPSEDV